MGSSWAAVGWDGPGSEQGVEVARIGRVPGLAVAVGLALAGSAAPRPLVEWTHSDLLGQGDAIASGPVRAFPREVDRALPEHRYKFDFAAGGEPLHLNWFDLYRDTAGIVNQSCRLAPHGACLGLSSATAAWYQDVSTQRRRSRTWRGRRVPHVTREAIDRNRLGIDLGTRELTLDDLHLRSVTGDPGAAVAFCRAALHLQQFMGPALGVVAGPRRGMVGRLGGHLFWDQILPELQDPTRGVVELSINPTWGSGNGWVRRRAASRPGRSPRAGGRPRPGLRRPAQSWLRPRGRSRPSASCKRVRPSWRTTRSAPGTSSPWCTRPAPGSRPWSIRSRGPGSRG